MGYHSSVSPDFSLTMTCTDPATTDFTLRWEEGEVDHRQEHFQLRHSALEDRVVAIVGPREPVGVYVRFMPDLPEHVERDLRDELWSWCTPQSEDPWFAVDLWYNLAEYALDENVGPGTVRWELVPRRATPDSEPPFVEDVTALYRTWLRHAGAELSGADEEGRQKQGARAAFLRDYVALFALVGGQPRQTVGRLARLVRLQTGEDPTARFEVRLSGPASGDVPIRVGHIEDFNFADAWACVPYDGFVVTKLQRPGRDQEAPKWRRGEVRALLRHVDTSLASEMPGAGLMAETDGPRLFVRFSAED